MSGSSVSGLKASIDLGTNTALLLVLNSSTGEVIEDRSKIVRLGKGVDQSGLLLPEAMDCTLRCLENYAEVIKSLGVIPADVFAVSTATARDSKNGLEFFKKVAEKTGFHFKTLSGEEEAKASFEGGLLPEMIRETTLLFDLGGGSLEFQTALEGISLQMGSVRFTERYLKSDPVTDEEFWACEDAINMLLLPLKARFSSAHSIVGVAGSVVALGALHLGLEKFDRLALDGATLTRGDVHRLVEDLKWRSKEERLLMPGMEKGREDVILAGALIVWRILETLSFKELVVSTRGLRYGVLKESTLK